MGLLDVELNSSGRPELFSSPGPLLAHPWSAQLQSVPGQPSPSCSAQQSVPGVPNPRVPLPREGGHVRSNINTVVIIIIISMMIIILRGCAHGRAAHAEARGEQFLSMLRPLNSLKISKR